MTYALDEIDKHIDYLEFEDAVRFHYAAVALWKLKTEYRLALDHANSLVDMLPDSAKALETRSECWELMDNDTRNLRGHFDRIGIERVLAHLGRQGKGYTRLDVGNRAR